MFFKKYVSEWINEGEDEGTEVVEGGECQENGASFQWGDPDQLRPDANHSHTASFFPIHLSFSLGRIEVSGKEPKNCYGNGKPK